MKGRVLIADDASFMRQMIREIIEPEGFEIVAEAGDGIVAVEQYQAVRPDIVTMDIVMPKRSGIDATRAILELDPEACIVMCSALGQQVLVMEALQAGAKDFIVKPFRPDSVLETLSKLVAKRD
ncbi:MAG: response regulator [Myxococcota bacterium]|nr:response regulator [Myxococcota bacterium]